MKKLLLLAIVVLGISAVSFGQAPTEGAFTTESGTATATIITPLTVTAGDDLAFGNIAVSANDAGTVTITSAGVITSDGGATIPSIPGTQNPASFTITGQANCAISVYLPEDGVVTIGNGTDDMNVNDFENSAISALDGSGNGSFTVGATLEVGAGQSTGNYTGEFDVIVIYN